MACLTPEHIELLQDLLVEEVGFLRYWIRDPDGDHPNQDTTKEQERLAKCEEIQSMLTSLQC